MLKGFITCAILSLALSTTQANPVRADVLRVFAAASLTDAFREIGESFEASHPGVTVEFNFAGAQVLRTQIEQGAQADVFASADRIHSEAMQQKGLLSAITIFTRNELVVVVPASSPRVKGLIDLARPNVKIVIAGSTVPAGRYTSQVLRTMTASGLYGDDFQARVQTNVVSQESNVRAVLSKVAMDEADAGFVYRSDALSATAKVRVMTIPPRLNVIAEYPIGILSQSASQDSAREFVNLVTGPDGQAILLKYGFMR